MLILSFIPKSDMNFDRVLSFIRHKNKCRVSNERLLSLISIYWKKNPINYHICLLKLIYIALVHFSLQASYLMISEKSTFYDKCYYRFFNMIISDKMSTRSGCIILTYEHNQILFLFSHLLIIMRASSASVWCICSTRLPSDLSSPGLIHSLISYRKYVKIYS